MEKSCSSSIILQNTLTSSQSSSWFFCWSSGKLSFVAWNEIWDNDGKHRKFQYFEYDENHESTTPIQRSRRIILTSPFKDIIFVGSCNGLICFSRECFSGESRGRVYVCNPVTREYVVLPRINTDSNMHAHIGCSTGFGYVSSKNLYIVVGIYVGILQQWTIR